MGAETPSRQPRPWVLGVSSLVGCFPLALETVLYLLRPDLVEPLMRDPSGHLVFAAQVACTLLGAGALLAVCFARSRVVRWVVRVLAVLCFTLPAVFLALFAPIAFAFLHGA